MESAAVDDAALSRRQVLARGAVITGVAWTAPALLAARPAFAGASICPNQQGAEFFQICATRPITEVCCPNRTDLCFVLANGQTVCQPPLGALCGNRGNGQCAGNTARCDQPANDKEQPFGICGGPGAQCGPSEVCLFKNCSATDSRCGGLNATCTDNKECAQPDPNDKDAFFCRKAEGTASGTCQRRPVA